MKKLFCFLIAAIMGDKDCLRLYRLSDELAVVEGDSVGGYLGYRFDFYRLKQGVWQLSTHVEKSANSRLGVAAYECNDSRVRLENEIMVIDVP
jgi:hypothetical protein